MPNLNIAELLAVSEIAGQCDRTDALNISGISFDTRSIKTGELFTALHGKDIDGHQFVSDAFAKGAAGALVEKKWIKGNPDVPNDGVLFVVEDSLKALQQLAVNRRKKLNIPVIGITGTNGKTTTKELTAAVLSRKLNVCKNPGNYNNHLGVPLSVLQTEPYHDVLIIEMGANHPGEIAFLSNIESFDIFKI